MEADLEIVLDGKDEPNPDASTAKGEDKPSEKGAEKNAKGGQDDEARQLRDELKATRAKIAELERSERFWAERAQAAGQTKEPERKAEPEPDDDPEKLVDEFSTKGMKALISRGVLTRVEAEKMFRTIAAEEARKVAEAERGNLNSQAALLQEFPELSDRKSAFWEETSKFFQRAVERNPSKKDDPDALWDAAEKARLKLGEGPGRNDKEEARRRRIAAQAGDRGGFGRDSFEDDGDELSENDREVMGAFGLSPEVFLKAKKDMVGVPGRRR